MTTRLSSHRDLLDLGGKELGTSGWIEITQKQVDLFAEATGDHQWIHVDTERAKAGPFGGTIAHGYLTLALAPVLLAEILTVENFDEVLNYGVNKVRFTAPIPVGSKVRGVLSLKEAKEKQGGTVEATFGIRYEVEGSERPACLAETVYLYR